MTSMTKPAYNDTSSMDRTFRIVRGQLRPLMKLNRRDVFYIMALPDEDALKYKPFTDVPGMLTDRTALMMATLYTSTPTRIITFQMCDGGIASTTVLGNIRAIPNTYIQYALRNANPYHIISLPMTPALEPTDTVSVIGGIQMHYEYKMRRAIVRQAMILASDKTELANALKTHAKRMLLNAKEPDIRLVKNYVRKTAKMILEP